MFALLQRQNLAPRPVAAILVNPSIDELKQYLPMDGSVCVVDCETNGTDVTLPDTCVVGLGVSNAEHSFYVDLKELNAEGLAYLIAWLKQAQLIGYNVFFDGAFLQKLTGAWLNWIGDCYALYKGMSNEGHPGQSWRLKDATVSVLGWAERHDKELRRWLIEHGHTKGAANAKGD